MAFQLRRGTNAQRSSITPLQGELLYTTDTKNLYVGDGTTAGGTIVSGGGGGATYAISAETTTGGANLRLTGSDSTTDNVKLAEGANVTITRTDINTITISSTGTGGAANLNDLGDVVITGTPTDGDVLTWDNGISTWVNSAPTGYTNQMAQDAVGDLLGAGTHTGVTFDYDPVAHSLGLGVDFDYISDLLVNGVNTGITFTYDALTNTLTSVVTTPALDDLSDVLLGTPVINDILRYDGFAWTESAETQWTVADDPAPALGGDLDLASNNITGTGGISITGDVSATNMVVNNGMEIVTELGVGGLNPILDVSTFNSTFVGGSQLYRARGTKAVPVALTPGDDIWQFRFIGQGSNLSAAQLGSCGITATTDPLGTPGTNFIPGQLDFRTRNDAGVSNVAMSLNRDGKITVKANTLVGGVSSGQVDEPGGPVSYLYIKVGSTEYALPLFGINP